MGNQADNEGYQIDVTTDYMVLKWLNKIENPLGKIAF